MKKGINIGLDIGIASVGWAITDQDLNILKHGVRMFKSADTNGELENVKRREARSLRRRLERKKTLKRDFLKLCLNHKFVEGINLETKENVKKAKDKFRNEVLLPVEKKWTKKNDLPYILKLRKEALKKKIDKNELLAILYFFLSFRGWNYELSDKDDKSFTAKFNKLNKEKSALEIQIENFNKNKTYRLVDNRGISRTKITEEVDKILSKQELDDSFKSAYRKLFLRNRSYAQGPGNKKTIEWLTNVGKEKGIENFGLELDAFDENGKVKPEKNLWDKLIGKCAILKDENRAPKKSCISAMFNMVNEIVNLRYGSKSIKLEAATVDILVKAAFDAKDYGIKRINKVLDKNNIEMDLTMLSGFMQGRPEKNAKGEIVDKRSLTSQEAYSNFKRIFKDTELANSFLVTEQDTIAIIVDKLSKLDEIVLLLSKIDKQFKEDRVQKLTELDILKDASSEIIDKIADLNNFFDTHSLSTKQMIKEIPAMVSAVINHMQFLTNEGIGQSSKFEIEKQKLIPNNWIDECDEPISPTVKKAVRQSMKIINAVLKSKEYRNQEILSIVVEMPRDSNSKKEKEAINSIQKLNEETWKKVEEYLKRGKVKTSSKKGKGILLKTWLWLEQDKKDYLTGLSIKREDLFIEGKYETDHIVPFSICHDDSRNNKALTISKENALKSDKTPYFYLKDKDSGGHWSKMKVLYKKWYKGNFRKFQKIISEVDYTSGDNTYGFIGRNLVDTRWASRLVLNYLTEWFAVNGSKENKTLMVPIRGRTTNYIRKMVQSKYTENPTTGEIKHLYKVPVTPPDTEKLSPLEKQRYWNGHHAEDAYFAIVAANCNSRSIKAYESFVSDGNKNKDAKIDWISKNDDEFNKKIETALMQLNKTNKEIVFTYQKTFKSSIQFANETTYSGRIDKQNPEKVMKINSKKILDITLKDAKKWFGKDAPDKEKLLIFNDTKLWEAISSIVEKFDKKIKDTDPVFKIYIEQQQEKDLIKLKLFTKENYENKTNALIIVSNKGKTVKLKNIRYRSKSTKSVFEILEYNHGDGRIGFNESLAPIGWDIIKTSSKYYVIPLTVKTINFKTRKINQDNYENFVKDIHGIKQDYKLVKRVKKNQMIIDDTGNILRINGSKWKLNCVETKPINITNAKSMFKVVNKMIGWEFIDTDILGLHVKKTML